MKNLFHSFCYILTLSVIIHFMGAKFNVWTGLALVAWFVFFEAYIVKRARRGHE